MVVACSVSLLAWGLALKPKLAPCYAAFEISAACITARELDRKALAYRGKIAEATMMFGSIYQVTLQLTNHPVGGGYDPQGLATCSPT